MRNSRDSDRWNSDNWENEDQHHIDSNFIIWVKQLWVNVLLLKQAENEKNRINYTVTSTNDDEMPWSSQWHSMNELKCAIEWNFNKSNVTIYI